MNKLTFDEALAWASRPGYIDLHGSWVRDGLLGMLRSKEFFEGISSKHPPLQSDISNQDLFRELRKLRDRVEKLENKKA